MSNLYCVLGTWFRSYSGSSYNSIKYKSYSSEIKNVIVHIFIGYLFTLFLNKNCDILTIGRNYLDFGKQQFF